ncbi:MAG TPA: NnrS family protein [Vitreimonas sp.]|uniref:NnrS family protein n=1 Tax=Vitreimonas sp. TaxID=3069702 RepID=UPI002D433895|nr:NnrS family protein [Vitreimonas sp.]HYD89291.1 NnrS family protein [Vitreimonas sp.]
MTTTAERYRAHKGIALFGMGFRPFFLFGSLWAALSVPLWVASVLGWAPEFTRDWHVHEMLFGYLAAIVAGFLLTAIPNWTGRLPVSGAPLAALFALWVAGRLAMLAVAELGVWASAIDSLFLVAFALIAWREVLAGKNTRNIPVCVMVTLLAAANIAFHLRVPAPDAVWIGERIALAVAALLIALIGGRITPSFTRNWMAKRAMTPEPAPQDKFDLFTLALTGAALLLWLLAPLSPFAGVALLASGAATLLRLARWRGMRTAAEPLVLILHVGYFWLAAGLLLLGFAAIVPSIVPASAGIHALAAGAIGVMTLAVMTRATRGHTGRELTAPRGTQFIYAAANLAALTRVAAALIPAAYTPLLIASALLWSIAFGAFCIIYGRMLTNPRPARA